MAKVTQRLPLTAEDARPDDGVLEVAGLSGSRPSLTALFTSEAGQDLLLVSGTLASKTLLVSNPVRVINYNIHGPSKKRFAPILKTHRRREKVS